MLQGGSGWVAVGKKNGQQLPAIVATQETLPKMALLVSDRCAGVRTLVPLAARRVWSGVRLDDLAGSRQRAVLPFFTGRACACGRARCDFVLVGGVDCSGRQQHLAASLQIRLQLRIAQYLEYVAYIARRRFLPLANQGWQMFQPPRSSLPTRGSVVCPLVDPLRRFKVIVRVLRIVPLLCGLTQIEIVYRVTRAGVTAERRPANDRHGGRRAHADVESPSPRSSATNLLAGCLTALLVLLMRLASDRKRRRHGRSVAYSSSWEWFGDWPF